MIYEKRRFFFKYKILFIDMEAYTINKFYKLFYITLTLWTIMSEINIIQQTTNYWLPKMIVVNPNQICMKVSTHIQIVECFSFNQ
jgi:hypothetical protein